MNGVCAVCQESGVKECVECGLVIDSDRKSGMYIRNLGIILKVRMDRGWTTRISGFMWCVGCFARRWW